jgi:hypothetical protein
MEALDAHTSMSTQALNSAMVQQGLKDILLNHALRTPKDRVDDAGVGARETVLCRGRSHTEGEGSRSAER